jgi:hypothetical protein
MTETKQQDDLATRLNDAVLRAAMPDISGEQNAIASLQKPVKSEESRRGGAFVKGGVPGPGRPKGSVPKAVKTIRDAVLEAFDQVGGVAYLAKLAAGTQSDRAAFVGLVSKVLPTQVNATVEGGVQVQLSWLGARGIGQTQVVDLERQVNGKYQIADTLHPVIEEPSIHAAGRAGQADVTYNSAHNGGAGAGGQAGKAAGDAQGA